VADLAPTPPQANASLNNERQMAFVIYVVYLVALALPPLAILGLVLAYVSRDAAPDWLKSHYEFQIRTFWLTLLYFLGAAILCVVLIGLFLLVAVWALWVLRCALGLSRLVNREPYPRPDALLL
jgi:uncharacterized membrane protein